MRISVSYHSYDSYLVPKMNFVDKNLFVVLWFKVYLISELIDFEPGLISDFVYV